MNMRKYDAELKEDMAKTRSRIERATQKHERDTMKRKEFTEEEGLRLKRILAYELAWAETIARDRIYALLEECDYGPWEGDIHITLDITRI